MIKLVVDSTCDLEQSILEELNVCTLPITVDINGKVYKDKIDLTVDDFYKKIREKDVFPKTAQVIPSVMENIFKDELEKGNEVVCITISSGLSGTYNSANIVKNMIGSDKIHIIDSRSASLGFGMIVIELAKMIKDGASVKQLIDRADYIIRNQEAIAYVDSLEMLKRGGRISPSAATLGGVLGIKPIIAIDNGLIKSIGKARGKMNALKHLAGIINSNNIDKDIGLYVAHSNIDKGCDEDLDIIKEYGVNHEITISHIGAAVGTHVGEGALALFFVKKD